jgi:hypothetical protein
MVSARVERDLAQRLQRTAREDDRTRTDQLAHLVRLGLAARARIAEFERMAVEAIAAQNHNSTVGTAAAAAHLAEHRRLTGLKESDHGD